MKNDSLGLSIHLCSWYLDHTSIVCCIFIKEISQFHGPIYTVFSDQYWWCKTWTTLTFIYKEESTDQRKRPAMLNATIRKCVITDSIRNEDKTKTEKTARIPGFTGSQSRRARNEIDPSLYCQVHAISHQRVCTSLY